MLRSLFGAAGAGGGDVGVTAVGDPNQSIYGWRGASATTLTRFPREFADERGEAQVLPLRTSWRNDHAILDVANTTSTPLRSAIVAPLRARPDAGPGRVEAARLETTEDEAAYVADWVARRWRSPSGRRTNLSAAVLCRKRAQFPLVVEALKARDLPVEVVGLGGLLLTPEVNDLVSLLWVVQDPSRGDRLMRLLTGPFCRLGPADLDGLASWARAQQRATGPCRVRRRSFSCPAWRPRPTRTSRSRGSSTRPHGGATSRAWYGIPALGEVRDQAPGELRPARASSRRSTTCRRRRGAVRTVSGSRRPGSTGSVRSAGWSRTSAGSPACRWPSWSARASAPWVSTSRCWPARSTPSRRRGPTSTPSPRWPRPSRPRPTGPTSAGSWPGSTRRSSRSAASTRRPSRRRSTRSRC